MHMHMPWQTAWLAGGHVSRRWLGSFASAHEAGQAYDLGVLVRDGTSASTNFAYAHHMSKPRPGAMLLPAPRWELFEDQLVGGCACFYCSAWLARHQLGWHAARLALDAPSMAHRRT